MMTLLLMIIFTSFISLGLPDSLLGAAWPVMHLDLGVPLANAGSLSMIISGGTILSSLFSGKLIARFGTGKLTLISVLMTAVALFGFYSLPSFFWLVIAAIPLGLGGGAVDAGLNNFVALHYRAQYMNWLHCFWGVGATIGPIILAYFIGQNNQWRKGYLAISIIQFILVVILFLSLPLWKKVETDLLESQPESKKNESKNLFKVKGIFPALISFFSYSAVETTAHVWGSSYLVNYQAIPAKTAANWLSLFFVGITLGRFIAGFLTIKITSKHLMRAGSLAILAGSLLMTLPLPSIFLLIGLILIGLGCAPIYPAMVHEIPQRFGKTLSQSIIGFQMAFAAIGSMTMHLFFGFLTTKFSMSIYPYFLLVSVLVMIASTERINYSLKNE